MTGQATDLALMRRGTTRKPPPTESSLKSKRRTHYARLQNSSLALEGSVDGASVEKLRWLEGVLESDGDEAPREAASAAEAKKAKPLPYCP